MLRNTSAPGALSFGPRTDYLSGGNTSVVKVGDLDGDGKQDIIAANFGGHSISLLRNISANGLTNLATKLNLPTAETASGVVVADLNNDGKPEVIASVTQSYLSFFKNNSTPGNLSFDATESDPTRRSRVLRAITPSGHHRVARLSRGIIPSSASPRRSRAAAARRHGCGAAATRLRRRAADR